ncbi:AcrR family transcriptional regulator [Clostridium punense]|uniref:AcrR family transcriptional regulator n=1 Tax=Clostridium punense TaxID=1054297 RepID=A0ABS4K279_9CLOT|nr:MULTISPECIES: TetR/AcrR family transcriptional regulator [Clostridium]MBP2021241.1 AcrR family transcriptional regulator [Clostridium punense]
MKKSFLKRKEAIILSAIEIIDELGFQGLSTKELAKSQEITEGALYKHFTSKEEIILAVIDYYGHYDDIIAQTVEMKNMAPKDALVFAVGFLAEYYENYPAITAIANSYEVFKYNSLAKDKIRAIHEKRVEFLSNLILRGVNLGDFPNSVKAEQFAKVIKGFFRETISEWRMNDYNFSLKERILSTLDMLFSIY